MEKIKIAITGRVASVVALPEVVADNAEYEVDFALDPREGWDMALPITALFVRRDGSYTPRILDAGATSCTMPPQTGTNIVYVGLTQDDMRTTTPATIKVHRSIRTVAHDPLPAPSEDVYAQILAAYAGIKTLSGKGAPTLATQGKVNQLYRDEDTQRLYICTATDGGYTWAVVSGGSVDVDATLTKAGYAADAKAAGDAIQKATDKNAVRFVAQELTDEQKEQARKNIGANPKLFYLPNEKIASSIKFTSPTSGAIYCKFENVLLSLHNGTNHFSIGGNYLYIDKTENADGSVQFKARSNDQDYKPNSIECKKYYGDLYIVSIVYARDNIDSLYAPVSGCLMDASIINRADRDSPGVIKINPAEYDEALYNPLMTDGNGYGVSYNEFSITTASDVGTVFRTQKAKAILVTDNIQNFEDGGFIAPYFMVQLSTGFADGIITNDYMVMAPGGVFFAIGVMSIRGTSNTVSWQIKSDKFGLNLSIISDALNNLYANSLRPPTTAQVGQIVKVKAVDAGGKITETETVDMPNGLPTPSPSDIGKCLAVVQTGEHEVGYDFNHLPNINDFVDLGIDNAIPGQILRVFGINDFGNPVAYETVDIEDVIYDGVTVKSSTEGSTKKFKITIDDSGTISATELV